MLLSNECFMEIEKDMKASVGHLPELCNKKVFSKVSSSVSKT